MTFQRNIPQPGDLISVSQDNLLQNFQAINDSYDVNHILFNLAGDGKHKFVEMPTQITDPAGGASEVTIFARAETLPFVGEVNLWYKRNAEATAFQLTGTNPLNDASGHTFLPGGLLMQWLLVASPNDNDLVDFPIAFGDTPYSLQLTAQRNGTSAGDVNGTSLTATNFRLRLGSNSNTGVWVLVVGPQ